MSLRTCSFGHPLLALLLALACGPQAAMTTDESSSTGEPASGTTTTATTTASGPATTSTTTSTGSGATASPTTTEDGADSTTEGAQFIIPPEGCGLASGDELGLRCSQVSCSVWDQDCPSGYKCVPHSADGDNNWESERCVPLHAEPGQPGEPCTVEGSVATGIDTCDLGVMCWDVDEDTLEGTCVAMCEGNARAPICDDPTTACASSNDGVINLCLPSCDPLAQECAADELCVFVGSNFICAPDASGDEGQLFDACEFVNVCDLGLACVDALAASECDPLVAGCCLPYCDLDLPPSCPGAMQQCVPWYEPGEAPPGNEDLGFCTLQQ